MQWYLKVPLCLNTRLTDCPGWTALLKLPVLNVTVCGASLLSVQTTLSPALIDIDFGV